MTAHRHCARRFTLLATGGVRQTWSCGATQDAADETAVDVDILADHLPAAHHHHRDHRTKEQSMNIRRLIVASAIALGALLPVLAYAAPAAHATPAATCISLPNVQLPSVCDIKAGVTASVNASVSASLSAAANLSAVVSAILAGTLKGGAAVVALLKALLCL